MKLVFFSFVFLLGVLLIHAQKITKEEGHAAGSSKEEGHAGASSAKPSPSKSEHPASIEKVESKATNASANNSKSDADQKPALEPTINPTKGSDSKTPATEPTDSPARSSTTAKPPTPFPAGFGSWNVTDPITKLPCIMVSGTISLTATMNNSKFNGTKTIDLGPATPAEGQCQQKYIRFHLDPAPSNSTLQFKFSVNASTHEVFLSQVDGLIFVSKNGTVGFQNATLHAFETPANKSYYCGKSIELPLKEEKDEQIAVKLENFRIQAFKTSKSNSFDESIDGCPTSGGSPDVIPIVVGCALAVLVVVVLGAYLVNRRRSQAHGYLSM